MEKLLSHLHTYNRLSEEVQQILKDAFTRQVLPKNASLITEGKVCRHLYFLEQGSVRGYYHLVSYLGISQETLSRVRGRR